MRTSTTKIRNLTPMIPCRMMIFTRYLATIQSLILLPNKRRRSKDSNATLHGSSFLNIPIGMSATNPVDVC